MAISAFTPDVAAGASFSNTSSVVAIPNPADGILYITNLGPYPLSFKLGTVNTITVTSSNAMILMPGQALAVVSTGVSYIAGMAVGAPSNAGSTVNLCSGT